MANRIILNETSYFGWGSREVLVDEIKRRKFKKASKGYKVRMDTLHFSPEGIKVFAETKPFGEKFILKVRGNKTT